MSSPQLEDGFVRIANELMDAILLAPLTGREVLVVLALIRKTYGFNKKEDDISASQLGKICNLSRPHVTECLNSLARKNVITKRPGTHGTIVGIQKNYKRWIEDPIAGVKRTPHGEMEGNHYTYIVKHVDSGEFYVGVRTCQCLPTQDRYKGSGQWVSTVEKRKLSKEILGVFDTRETAHKDEQDRIRSFSGNPLCRNVIVFLSGTPCTNSVQVGSTESVHSTESVQGVQKNDDLCTNSVQVGSTESVHSTESVQGVQKNDDLCTNSVQVGSTESVHTIDNVPKDNSQKKGARQEITFRKWMDQCRTESKDPIPEDDPVFAYADEMKIPMDFIRYGWVEFKRKYGDSGKRYKNWSQHFQNAIRENWYGIWFDKDDEWQLTTRGKQIEKEVKAREQNERA